MKLIFQCTSSLVIVTWVGLEHHIATNFNLVIGSIHWNALLLVLSREHPGCWTTRTSMCGNQWLITLQATHGSINLSLSLVDKSLKDGLANAPIGAARKSKPTWKITTHSHWMFQREGSCFVFLLFVMSSKMKAVRVVLCHEPMSQNELLFDSIVCWIRWTGGRTVRIIYIWETNFGTIWLRSKGIIARPSGRSSTQIYQWQIWARRFSASKMKSSIRTLYARKHADDIAIK